MNIQTIAEHSVDLDLLSGGICIDAGCRGFQFSEAMRDLGLKVLAFDLEDMEAPAHIQYVKYAIGAEVKLGHYIDTKDKQAKYISNVGKPIAITTLDIIYESLAGVEPNVCIDILKLDIEGSEYKILSDSNFRPVPKQISVEFHMHCHRTLHDQYYDKCMENLLKWYEPVKHELTQAHGAGWNYWDSLFIRRDLL